VLKRVRAKNQGRLEKQENAVWRAVGGVGEILSKRMSKNSGFAGLFRFRFRLIFLRPRVMRKIKRKRKRKKIVGSTF